MRNALILLAVVALLILTMGALNNGTAFDIDYVAGAVTAVSLLWVSAVIAVLVFVVGLAASWFAVAATKGSRRKLEAELQSTYERLREAEALAARPAPAAAPEVVAATVVADREPPTVAETGEVTVVAGEAATEVQAAATEDEAATVVQAAATEDEAATVVAGAAAAEGVDPNLPPASDDEEPAVGDAAPGTDASEGAAGEQTAVTMAGEAPQADEPASESPADESAESRSAADDAGRPGPSS